MTEQITTATVVKKAVSSSPEAVDIFERHGVAPNCSCKGMYDNITLEEAEEWCGIKDLPGLLTELNAALAKTQATK